MKLWKSKIKSQDAPAATRLIDVLNMKGVGNEGLSTL
jgi:hypothetical protein